MKKFTFVLIALLAGAFAMQMNAQEKDHSRSTIYSYLPAGFEQVGETSVYYNIVYCSAAGPGYQYGISILGEINGQYYSSTYEYGGPGAGFIGAFKVDDYSATYLDALNGTTSHGVTMTARVDAQGEVAARIVYSLTNNNSEAVTVSAGVWGDVMIGDNDFAPLARLKNNSDETYGIKMKYSNAEGAPLLCALFGEGLTGVTPADDYWFGYYRTNYYASEICGAYYDGSYYMVENGNYDSGMGWCWKNRPIEAGETIELSYLISVGEIDFEEPIVPGEDVFTYNVEAYNFDGWNDLAIAHLAHIWGYYEHPYGQEGYIEYQVDGDRGWTRIPTALVSGENYDLPFDMSFNQERTTDHVLQLRFTDGLGNYTDLDGLSWVDVRSFDVSGFENRVYNGSPQEFVVSINNETFTYVGETYPGEYNYTIEGVYADNTIGINEVPYTIDKAPCEYDVELPFPRIDYDGDPHAATVTVPEGSGDVTITYVNSATGEATTEAPSDPGIYDVYVAITEGDYYYGIDETNVGRFEIYSAEVSVNELTVGTQDNGAWYTIDGRRIVAPTERGIYIHNGKKYIVK